LTVIKIDSLNQSSFPALLCFNIESGNYVKYNRIDFKGNKISKSEILIRQSHLQLKDKFNEKELSEARNWLYKTQLFRKKPEFEIFRSNNQFGILFSVEEKKYISLMVLGGYSSNNKSENYSGLAEIKTANLFGTMRKAELLWERIGDEKEKLRLKYREPFMFNIPIASDLSFYQNYKKGIYLSRAYGFEEVYDIDPRSSIKFGIRRENIYTDSLYLGLDKDITTDRYSGGIKYSTLYNKESIPKSTGYEIEWEIASLSVDIEDSLKLNGLEILFSAGILFKPADKIYFSIKTGYNQVLFADDMPEFNKIYFGGSGSFRGYREEFFLSDILLKQSIDFYFVPSSEDIAFNLFFENGQYNEYHSNIQKIDRLTDLWSYGGGIIFEGRLGEIEVTIGVPGREGFAESMVHVSYSMTF
ncbi:MAG: BamA/TamA family outer membrane protein, partial [Candidatus Delongbacteria bacterium]|nr:BamA/TamA family outer membrane protein [Candidatus Delongbacteria bacterium]MCG2761501.1 BamA/TamA family outer membrane protein [Candidatus Delongbacteria bacterium]